MKRLNVSHCSEYRFLERDFNLYHSIYSMNTKRVNIPGLCKRCDESFVRVLFF